MQFYMSISHGTTVIKKLEARVWDVMKVHMAVYRWNIVKKQIT